MIKFDHNSILAKPLSTQWEFGLKKIMNMDINVLTNAISPETNNPVCISPFTKHCLCWRVPTAGQPQLNDDITSKACVRTHTHKHRERERETLLCETGIVEEAGVEVNGGQRGDCCLKQLTHSSDSTGWLSGWLLQHQPPVLHPQHTWLLQAALLHYQTLHPNNSCENSFIMCLLFNFTCLRTIMH